MSTDRPIDDYLADIIEAISDIRSFIAGLDYAGFAADKKTVNAVIRSLEVIGEAVKKNDLDPLEKAIRSLQEDLSSLQ